MDVPVHNPCPRCGAPLTVETTDHYVGLVGGVHCERCGLVSSDRPGIWTDEAGAPVLDENRKAYVPPF